MIGSRIRISVTVNVNTASRYTPHGTAWIGTRINFGQERCKSRRPPRALHDTHLRNATLHVMFRNATLCVTHLRNATLRLTHLRNATLRVGHLPRRRVPGALVLEQLLRSTCTVDSTPSLRHQHVWTGATPSHGKQGEVPKACRRCQATQEVRGRAGMQASGARIIPVKVVG